MDRPFRHGAISRYIDATTPRPVPRDPANPAEAEMTPADEETYHEEQQK
ncbi:MAG: hypothetical protein ABR585_07335 [Gemmatimonadaceae bacterium]